MSRLLRLAAVACIAPLITACGGGTPHTAPPASVAPAGQAQAPQSVAAVPTQALRGGLAVSVHLPLRNEAELDGLIQRQADQNSPDYHHFLTPQQFRDRYAPPAADLATVATTLRGLGFDAHVTSQSVLAAAPQATVEQTFGIHVRQTTQRGRAGLSLDRAVTLPQSLAKLGATVSVSALAKHVYSKRVSKTPYVDAPANRYSNVGPYWFTDLKQAYGYPAYQTVNGAGHSIGVVISSDVLDSDLALYFGHEHAPVPTIERRPVNGGAGFDPNSGDSAEASLDVQQALGSAPGAHLVLYSIPSLFDNDIMAAYTAVVDDNKVDVVNSSFGLCELYYTAAYNDGTDYTSILKDYHDIFRQGNAQGITFVASSGDSGAYECENVAGTRFIKGVSNPADDTAVTAVGGTNLVTASVSGSLNSSYVTENANYDAFDPAQGALPNEIWGSGGGISVLFDKPWYQLLVNTRANKRTIPDISMHMGGCPVGSVQPCDPARSSVITAIGGSFYLLIGTSASSPEFAGLLAVTEQTLHTRLGNANGYIYALAAAFGGSVYRQNIPGNNGYPTTPGYDYVLGNGTPHAAVFAAQPFAPLAGNPQTPSNP